MASELKYVEAIAAAQRAELAADERVVVMGEDVGSLGGVFTATAGLQEEFGSERVIDTPISENGLVGWAVGASGQGMRPIVEIMFSDFSTLAMDQIVNGAAKLRYMSGGQFEAPIVLRMPSGAGTHQGAQHSQSLDTWFANTPGLVVAMPSTAADAYWMLREAVRIDDPVVYLESKYLYFRNKEVVDEDEGMRGFGARVMRPGGDLTVVSAARMTHRCLEAADHLADEVDCEVIDLRYLWPLDYDTIAASVSRTNRLAVVHEAVEFAGWGGEVCGFAANDLFWDLDAPVLRLGAERTPIAFSFRMEDRTIPTVDRIVERIRAASEGWGGPGRSASGVTIATA